MEWYTARTLATLRESLRLTREVRAAAVERGNLDIVALEDATIGRLEQRIAQIEESAERRRQRAAE